jgi:hypothetical protein
MCQPGLFQAMCYVMSVSSHKRATRRDDHTGPQASRHSSSCQMQASTAWLTIVSSAARSFTACCWLVVSSLPLLLHAACCRCLSFYPAVLFTRSLISLAC